MSLTVAVEREEKSGSKLLLVLKSVLSPFLECFYTMCVSFRSRFSENKNNYVTCGIQKMTNRFFIALLNEIEFLLLVVCDFFC